MESTFSLLCGAFGLFCSVCGTLFLLFSTKTTKFQGIAMKTESGMIHPTTTKINPKKFSVGLYLILAGFVLQMVPLFYQLTLN